MRFSGVAQETFGSPINGLTVVLYDTNTNVVSSTTTAADGSYVLGGVKPGDYYVATVSSGVYADEWYNDVISYSTPESDGAQKITSTLGNTVGGINFVLGPGGSIRGFVVDSSLDPITNVVLQLYDGVGDVLTATRSDTNGFYIFDGLPAGYELCAYGDRNELCERMV